MCTGRAWLLAVSNSKSGCSYYSNMYTRLYISFSNTSSLENAWKKLGGAHTIVVFKIALAVLSSSSMAVPWTAVGRMGSWSVMQNWWASLCLRLLKINVLQCQQDPGTLRDNRARPNPPEDTAHWEGVVPWNLIYLWGSVAFALLPTRWRVIGQMAMARWSVSRSNWCAGSARPTWASMKGLEKNTHIFVSVSSSSVQRPGRKLYCSSWIRGWTIGWFLLPCILALTFPGRVSSVIPCSWNTPSGHLS